MIPFVTRLSVPSPFSYQTLVTTDKISPNKEKKYHQVKRLRLTGYLCIITAHKHFKISSNFDFCIILPLLLN